MGIHVSGIYHLKSEVGIHSADSNLSNELFVLVDQVTSIAESVTRRGTSRVRGDREVLDLCQTMGTLNSNCLETHCLNGNVSCVVECFDRFVFFTNNMSTLYVVASSIEYLIVTTISKVIRHCFQEVNNVINTVLRTTRYVETRVSSQHSLDCFVSNQEFVGEDHGRTITSSVYRRFRVRCLPRSRNSNCYCATVCASSSKFDGKGAVI